MQLIKPDHSTGAGAKQTSYYATAVGISDSDIPEIDKEIRVLSKSGKVNINIRNDRNCNAIFTEYKRSLKLY